MRSLVYAYGCDAPISGLEYTLAEQERCGEFWDTLVAIERAMEAQVLQRAALDDPAIMRANEGIERLTARLADEPADKAAREERRALYKERRESLRTWNKAHRQVLRGYEERRQAAVKLARQQTAAWWPNYLRVLQAYESARQLCRQTGRRLRPYDASRDDGVLAYQFQRTSSGLGAAPDELMDGTTSAVQIGLTPRPHRRSRLMQMRVDAGGNTVTLPVHWHRELPQGARVKWAQLTWRQRAGRIRWQLCLTLNVPEVPLRITGAVQAASVQFCWERHGGLQVMSAGLPGQVPSTWALPPSWLTSMEAMYCRGDEIDARYAHLCTLAPQLPPSRVLKGMQICQSSWALLAAPQREAYRHLRLGWCSRQGQRHHLLGHRRELYRQMAREVVRRWPVIALPKLDLAAEAMAERGTPGNSDRHMAAIHTLRAEIIHQAAKIGTQVIASGDLPDASASQKASAWARRKNLAAERSRRRAGGPDNAGI